MPWLPDVLQMFPRAFMRMDVDSGLVQFPREFSDCSALFYFSLYNVRCGQECVLNLPSYRCRPLFGRIFSTQYKKG